VGQISVGDLGQNFRIMEAVTPRPEARDLGYPAPVAADRGTSDLPAISFGRAWTRGVTDGARRDLATAGEWAAAKPSALELSQSKAFIGSASATPAYLPA
jgi:hypothetical protein